ncbi:hypothetical protein M7I_3030 [Glarea lozoyensis 74030]|uniref:Uncharacterized protein n=1 Tax=Glarea lozoyensis (strain ATCC 74030 / MF5533) TaxID=1104152 RepID=H0EKD3_GLAL7|nr:hypothetical protein M7I_3030 [Glarea lozoyensis 74030]
MRPFPVNIISPRDVPEFGSGIEGGVASSLPREITHQHESFVIAIKKIRRTPGLLA